MKIKNIGRKIIGIGEVTVLPGNTADIPKAYENSPILEIYKKNGIAEISGKSTVTAKTTATDKAEAEKKAAEDAKKLRETRLASLDGATDEEVSKLANELGINPADCKDNADVLKKVKAALKK